MRYPRGTGPGVATDADLTPMAIGQGEYRRRISGSPEVRVAIVAVGSMNTPVAEVAEALDATHFNLRSMFSINPSLYSGHILICIMYLWALFKEKYRLTKFASVLVVAWAIAVHSGTGAIFAFVPRELYTSPLLPVAFGMFAGFDYGRVWQPGEASRKWHTSYGGGFFLNGAQRFSGNVSLFHGADGVRLSLGLGFDF